MIVTVSNIDGIKQYRVPDNIKKIIFVSTIIFFVLVAFLIWNVVHLNDKVSKFSSHANKELLGAKNKILTLQQTLESIEQRYADIKEEKLAQERNYAAKIAQLENRNHTISKRLKATEYSSVEKYEVLRRKEKKLSSMERKLREVETKLEKAEALNHKLAKIAKKNREEAERLLAEKDNRKKKQNSHVAITQKDPSVLSGKTQKIFKIAKQELGKHYVWGAVGPATFDCSGFTSYVFRQVGINIPRTSRQQAKYGKLVHKGQLKPGDLIFFDTDYNKKGIDHVGIYMGNDKFIHASSARKRVIITSLNKAFYKQRFKLARRVN